MRSLAVMVAVMTLPTILAAQKPKPRLGSSDLQIIARLHHANQTEVEFAELAKQKADAKEVKDFAEKLVNDHNSADQKLLDLTQDQSTTLMAPPKPRTDAERRSSWEEASTRQKLNALSGIGFDRAFVSAMIKDHEKDIAAVERAQKKARNPDLKNQLGDLLTAMKEHLETARGLAEKVGVATAVKQP